MISPVKKFTRRIDEVLKKGFNVRFRPHPENFKRSANIIEGFQKKFKNSKFIILS